jgi:hypothetical protein
MAEILARESACDDIGRGEGEILVEKGTNIFEMVIVIPVIQLGNALCLRENIVLEDCVKW